jgi:hypothetical protein
MRDSVRELAVEIRRQSSDLSELKRVASLSPLSALPTASAGAVQHPATSAVRASSPPSTGAAAATPPDELKDADCMICFGNTLEAYGMHIPRNVVKLGCCNTFVHLACFNEVLSGRRNANLPSQCMTCKTVYLRELPDRSFPNFDNPSGIDGRTLHAFEKNAKTNVGRVQDEGLAVIKANKDCFHSRAIAALGHRAPRRGDQVVRQ